MFRVVDTAGPGFTISHGGIIHRPGGVTWIDNCATCQQVVAANPEVINFGPRFNPRTGYEILGSKPLFPLPTQR